MKLAEMNEGNLSLRSRVINGVQKHYGVFGGEVWEVWEHTCGLHTFLLQLLNSNHKLLKVIRNFPNIPISGGLNKMVFLPNSFRLKSIPTLITMVFIQSSIGCNGSYGSVPKIGPHPSWLFKLHGV